MTLLPSEIRNAPLVTELFRAQAAETPDRLALVHESTQLRYAELDDRSTWLAGLLAQHGIGNGQLVAVRLGNSADLVVALLAVLKSGAGYVPLSVTDPPHRATFILRDAQASLLITAGGEAGTLPDSTRSIDVGNLDWGRASGAAEAHISGDDVAYVIYTSGSTGRPKGVIVEHGALAAYLAHVRVSYPGVRGRVLLHSSVSFDMAVTSLYAPLVTGGTLEVAALEEVMAAGETTPGHVQPSFLKVTPSHLRILRAMPSRGHPAQQLVIGGEALTARIVEGWRRDHPSVTVINEYGPTEATVGCCVHVVCPGQTLAPGPVPIGRPVPGTRLFVLDAALRPVGDGEIGELYISGDQLARGYLGRPSLTAGSFVANPFGPPGTRMYRTGDLVRWRNDGLLNFIGRVDGQLKIGGVRIEPAEVATVIMESGYVSQAVVTTYSTSAGQRQLVAYVTAPDGAEADVGKLREYVSALLPGPMCPAAYVAMPRLPLTASGKIDHSALPAPGEMRTTSPALPQTREEAVISRLISELTGVSPVGIDDDFFALGGSSLTAARLVVRARREGILLNLQDVLSMRTTRKLAGRGHGLPAEQQAGQA